MLSYRDPDSSRPNGFCLHLEYRRLHDVLLDGAEVCRADHRILVLFGKIRRQFDRDGDLADAPPFGFRLVALDDPDPSYTGPQNW